MYPAFVLHHETSTDRDDLVKDIVKKTDATVVQSVLLPNRKLGCTASHLSVAKLAKSLFPLQSYLVFEDDCVLSENWMDALKGVESADVVYLGYNDKCEHTVFGTHALLISPKARDKIISETYALKDQVIDRGAYDHILSLLCRREGLQTALPKMEFRNTFAYQKKGLVSLITGRAR
jgi:GR25 family glycosyltransferase involved in LPS biosynthesis